MHLASKPAKVQIRAMMVEQMEKTDNSTRIVVELELVCIDGGSRNW